MDDNLQHQEDEMAILDAMKTKENEFQWEYSDKTIVGILRVEPILEKCITVKPAASRLNSLLHSIQVKYLPSVELHFQLPPNYPSTAPPTFTLSSRWLNFAQLTVLCKCLDKIWDENEGMVILYLWQQFLSCDMLALIVDSEGVLSIERQIPLMSHGNDWDVRAIQEMTNIFEVIPFLVDHDRQQKEITFQSSQFPCEICYLTVSGSECIYLQACSHIHCTHCMREHVTNKISEGNICKIECPSFNCKEELPLNIIKDLTSEELFVRYDQLLLQRTLDEMKDIVYCPRQPCGCVTIQEENSNMGVCPLCKFSFCVLCKRTWHGIEPCKVLPADIKELKELYESGDDSLRKSLEQQYGRRHLLKAFQEYESHKWIKDNSKFCPNCNAKIEKNHGCNKMSCTNCSCNFCWLCGSMLPRSNPYAHFHFGSSSCGGRLFDGEIPDVDL
jgi:E3 ubiquitin-protein ligase RNF14